MRAAAARVGRRVGRRGAILILLGGVAALYGYSLVVEPPPTTVGVRLLLHVMPLRCWGGTLLVAGIIALASAPLRQGADRWGYTALVLVWTPWSLSYLTSWWLADNPRGWVAGLIFAAFAVVPAVSVGWPEAPAPSMRGADER